MPTAHPLTAARIGELLRLQILLEQPDLTLFDIRFYVADRLADLYPLDYLVYVRRWRALPPGAEPGPLLGFLEWWPLVEELAERATLAEMVEEAEEADGRVRELRAVLLVDAGDEPADPGGLLWD